MKPPHVRSCMFVNTSLMESMTTDRNENRTALSTLLLENIVKILLRVNDQANKAGNMSLD